MSVVMGPAFFGDECHLGVARPRQDFVGADRIQGGHAVVGENNHSHAVDGATVASRRHTGVRRPRGQFETPSIPSARRAARIFSAAASRSSGFALTSTCLKSRSSSVRIGAR